MAHKALIGGTEYAVKGGRTLVSGTGYKVQVGMSLVGGTGYKVKFSPLPLVTITGVGLEDHHEVNIGGTVEKNYGGSWIVGGTTYISETSDIEVEPGSTICFTITSVQQMMVGGYVTVKVTIDGNVVCSAEDGKTEHYQWTVPEGITSILIELPKQRPTFMYNGITVTTS
jgi:hypothetical protein